MSPKHHVHDGSFFNFEGAGFLVSYKAIFANKSLFVIKQWFTFLQNGLQRHLNYSLKSYAGFYLYFIVFQFLDYFHLPLLGYFLTIFIEQLSG